MFFDTFSTLCSQKGVSLNKACIEIGVSRTSVAKWKAGATPNGATLTKAADYFGVTTDYLLGGGEKEKTPTPEGERTGATDDDLKAAFWGGEKDLSRDELDEMWEDVKEYARYKAEQRRKKKAE